MTTLSAVIKGEFVSLSSTNNVNTHAYTLKGIKYTGRGCRSVKFKRACPFTTTLPKLTEESSQAHLYLHDNPHTPIYTQDCTVTHSTFLQGETIPMLVLIIIMLTKRDASHVHVHADLWN